MGMSGIVGNPLTELVAAYGMTTAEFSVGGYQAGGRPIANYDLAYGRLDPAATDAWVRDVATADAALEHQIAASTPDETYAQMIDKTLAGLAWEPARVDLLRHYYAHRTQEQCGAETDAVAAHGLDEDVVDSDEVIFPGGYDLLPRGLAAGLDVRLGHLVTSIDWSTTGVCVQATAATVVGRTAIVTVPLGVLKAGTIDIRPTLPDVLLGPIKRLGMGVFNKVFLQFPSRFWPADAYALRQLGPAGTPWHSWYDVSVISGQPMLLTFAGGDWGRQIESISDEEVLDSALESLRRIYPGAVPTPVAHWITRWGSDPLALGAYSYVAAGSSHTDHEALATPVDGVLHLAGEATWATDPATVHGALLSGHRAAERIHGEPLTRDALHTNG